MTLCLEWEWACGDIIPCVATRCDLIHATVFTLQHVDESACKCAFICTNTCAYITDKHAWRFDMLWSWSQSDVHTHTHTHTHRHKHTRTLSPEMSPENRLKLPDCSPSPSMLCIRWPDGARGPLNSLTQPRHSRWERHQVYTNSHNPLSLRAWFYSVWGKGSNTDPSK